LTYPFYDIVTSDSDCGQVFDLSVELDGYDGPVYIKPEHIQEMARTLGMADKETVDNLKYEIARLHRLVDALPEEVKVLEDGLSTLVADFHTRLADRADSISPVGESESDETDSESVSESVGLKLEESEPINDDSNGDFLAQLESEHEVPETVGQIDDNSGSSGPPSIRDDSGDKPPRIRL
jgi:hypothetical protein